MPTACASVGFLNAGALAVLYDARVPSVGSRHDLDECRFAGAVLADQHGSRLPSVRIDVPDAGTPEKLFYVRHARTVRVA